MPFIRERGVFVTAARVIVMYHESGKVASNVLYKCCVALSMLVDTDDFVTYTTEYVTSSDLDCCTKLHALCMKEYQGDSASRAAMRPLLDCINKLKRQLRK